MAEIGLRVDHLAKAAAMALCRPVSSAIGFPTEFHGIAGFVILVIFVIRAILPGAVCMDGTSQACQRASELESSVFAAPDAAIARSRPVTFKVSAVFVFAAYDVVFEAALY